MSEPTKAMSSDTNQRPQSPQEESEELKLKSTAIKQEEPANTNEVKSTGFDSDEDANPKIPFPVILHALVSNPETDHCIHWLPDGNLFSISDKKKFAEEILPKLDGHAKFTSFTRRLKRWGFSRISSGPQIGAYQNPDFIKDEPERVRNIKYMHYKPMSLTAAQEQNANSLATKMNVTSGGAFAQVPTEDLRLLQTLLAQQQMGMQMQVPSQNENPLEAYMRLAAGGNGIPNNLNSTNNPMMQLALLQGMQNQAQINEQQVQAATAVAGAPVESSKANETYGEMLVRTNPALAAQLLDATIDNKVKSMTQGNAASSVPSNPIMSMLASNNNPMPIQQLSMNPMATQGNSLNAMMLALVQQQGGQQQQHSQQQNDIIKNLMNRGQMNQQAQADFNSRGSDVVTPYTSSGQLKSNQNSDSDEGIR
eukprot:scaffold135711_cov77-Cyclotella_meneghiniana.AAC.6